MNDPRMRYEKKTLTDNEVDLCGPSSSRIFDGFLGVSYGLFDIETM